MKESHNPNQATQPASSSEALRRYVDDTFHGQFLKKVLEASEVDTAHAPQTPAEVPIVNRPGYNEHLA
jgi:hypothetical protein